MLDLVFGLALEAYGAAHSWWWAEPFVDVTTAAIFLWYVYRPPLEGITRTTLVSCLVLATLGELTFTALFQFYLYRQSVLPLFVPPGHVLLFLMGIAITRARWFHPRAALALPALVFTLFAWRIAHGQDVLSLGFYLILLPCLLWGPERSLYATMFSLALLLELYGTWLGTWAWQPKVLGFGLSLDSANPPLAAGAAYAMLDLLTFRAALLIGNLRRSRATKLGVR